MGARDAIKVLVADNDRDTVDSASILLGLMGYEVETALNGREALTRASTFKPQVVTLDLGMPVMDGFETAREFQRLGASPSPVLIAITGYADNQSRRRAAEAGFDLCLAKPIEAAIYEELPLLVERAEQLRANQARFDRIREHTVSALKSLTIAHLQTAHIMLSVAGTTENASTKACCLTKARRICDRLAVWIRRYPYLRDLSDDLEDLIRHLPHG